MKHSKPMQITTVLAASAGLFAIAFAATWIIMEIKKLNP